MTARLILIRHAKSAYPDGVGDHDRPLNTRGERDAPRIGDWLNDNVPLDDPRGARVVVSSAVRAQLTWRGIRSHLVSPWADVEQVTDERVYEASPATLRDVAAEWLGADAEGARGTLAMVGHNPGLLDLITELGIPSQTRSDAIDRFPTSAIAVLTSSLPWDAAIAGLSTFEVSSFGIPRG